MKREEEKKDDRIRNIEGKKGNQERVKGMERIERERQEYKESKEKEGIIKLDMRK